MTPQMPGRNSRRPTLKDVAQKAGVSTMAVSRAVCNRVGVSAENRARIAQAARELNYVPNQAARKLVERRPSHNIAFMFECPSEGVFAQMMSSGFLEASSSGAELVFIKVRPDRDAVRIHKTLANLGIEGVILSPELSDDAQVRKASSGAGIRVVAIGTDEIGLPHSAVGIDDHRASHQLTRHLLELGHRRIAFIDGPAQHRSSARRRAGYETALLEHGLLADPPLKSQGGNSYMSALASATEVLNRDPRPTAIVAGNHESVVAVLNVAKSRGIAIPDALSLCGFDDRDTDLAESRPCTAVCQPIGEIARWAVEQLVRELSAIDSGGEPEVRKVVLHHAIVHRGSDAPPAGAETPIKRHGIASP